MLYLTNLSVIAIISFLAALSPGPDFFIVVKNSLSYSRKMGFLTALGVALALLIHLTYTLVGLGTLITEGSFFYYGLKYLGAGYLFYIGFKGLIYSFKKQSNLDLRISKETQTISNIAAIRQGFFTNLLNPKCAFFFMSLFSQFILIDTPVAVKLSYAAINWSITLCWFLLLSYLITGKYLMNKLESIRLYVDRIMGILLILISLKITFS